jgi:hypothetical protein
MLFAILGLGRPAIKLFKEEKPMKKNFVLLIRPLIPEFQHA